MPFLRVIRDKRGYETTYLLHWYREGSRQRSRILYVFRSPGGVRVGRAPLEPEVLRQIEREYPEIAFDWSVVLENQQVVETNPEPRGVRRPRRRRDEEGDSAPPSSPAPERVARVEPPPVPPPAPRPAIPSTIEGATPDEQIAFLAHWYPHICERIQQRAADAERRDTLLMLAERLNSAGWSDADQITSGLLNAGEALERLSRIFAKRRRRPRKARKGDATGGAPEPSPQSSDPPAPQSSEPPSPEH